MTINFANFNALGTNQKMDAVWEWAFLVGKREGVEGNIFLYSLNGFFVEVEMRSSDNSIRHIEAIHLLSLDQLQGYALESNNPFLRAIA